MKIMERIIKSGSVYEKYTFVVGDNTKPRAPRRKGGTIARKQDANERACAKRLARSINCNFQRGDIFAMLSWSDAQLKKITEGKNEEESRAAVEHTLDLFLLRLRRELKKAGIELTYIAVTSDMDGDTGEIVRIHHHIIIKADGIEMRYRELWIGNKRLADIWGNGAVDYEPLRNQKDYTRLAEYLCRQVRRQPDKAKWRSSRNLKKPELISERIVSSAKKLTPPKGAKLEYDGAYTPGEPHYIRYTMDQKPRKRGGKRAGTEDTDREM